MFLAGNVVDGWTDTREIKKKARCLC